MTPRQIVSVIALAAASLLLSIAPASAFTDSYHSGGLPCSISSRPQSGCAQVVTDSSVTSSGSVSPSSSPAPAVHQTKKSGRAAGWAIGAVLIAALAGGSYWQSRRRRD
jgi:hypothetical protein